MPVVEKAPVNSQTAVAKKKWTTRAAIIAVKHRTIFFLSRLLRFRSSVRVYVAQKTYFIFG